MDKMCFKLINQLFCCLLFLAQKMLKTTKLLNPMVSVVELITHKWAIWHW